MAELRDATIDTPGRHCGPAVELDRPGLGDLL